MKCKMEKTAYQNLWDMANAVPKKDIYNTECVITEKKEYLKSFYLRS
jgi:hypothetical protein